MLFLCFPRNKRVVRENAIVGGRITEGLNVNFRFNVKK